MQPRNEKQQSDGVSKIRKPHTKSRIGCINCKRRRIKCDEQRPVCGHCNRHSLSCEYKTIWFQSDLNSKSTSSKNHSSNNPSSSSSSSSTSSSSLSSSGAKWGPPTVSSTVVASSSSQQKATTTKTAPNNTQTGSNHSPYGNWSGTIDLSNITRPIPEFQTPYVATPTLDTDPAQYFAFFSSTTSPLAGSAGDLQLQSINDGSSTTNMSMEDLEIFYFFLTQTVPTLCNSEDKVRCWRTCVPYLAFRDACLLHALLATAALHMYIFYQKKTPAKLQLAMHHYNTFSRLLSAGDLENLRCGKAPAMFASSVLMTFYVLASAGLSQSGAESSPQQQQQHRDHSSNNASSSDGHSASSSSSSYISSSNTARTLPLQVIPSWIPFLKGLQAVTKQNYQELKDSPIAPLLDPLVDFFRVKETVLNNPNSHGRNSQVWQRAAQPLLSRDKIFDEDYQLEETEFDTYVSAINWLLVVNEINGYMENSGFSTLLWALLVPSEYFQYLQQSRPRALVIFALHSILMHELSGYWWLQDGALKELNQIEHTLLNSTTPQMTRLIQYVRQSLLDNIEIRRPLSDLESYRIAW